MLADLTRLSRINVDQFYGIEIEEFPARIAEVAMWLVDHQMNNRLSSEFGHLYVRIPLITSPHIINANALKADWAGLVKPVDLTYILGNPPFIGHQYRSDDQVADHTMIWGTKGRFGRLDYVSCWYRKALDYIRANTAIRVAFVSTNSITQGEQASILWSYMFQNGAHIRFAHRTFQWASDARGKAAVHCVIIGFALDAPTRRRLFEYDDIKGDPHEVEKVTNINGYLIDGPDIALPTRTRPKPGYPRALQGSKPWDGGYLTLSDTDREDLLVKEPKVAPWIRLYLGSDELLSNTKRWCLWLKGVTPAELSQLPMVRQRLAGVRDARLASPTETTNELANVPTLFAQDRQPDHDYLAIPEVSSENRRFIPMTFLSANVIASNKLLTLNGATLFHFGVLSSTMHMAWVRHICGRLKSDYSYAPSVYNNFPFPKTNEVQLKAIEQAAQGVLDARASFADSSLADLYDPLAMPPELTKAHAVLDRVVDRAYRPQPFANERLRMEFLFRLYEVEVGPLAAALKRRGTRRTETLQS